MKGKAEVLVVVWNEQVNRAYLELLGDVIHRYVALSRMKNHQFKIALNTRPADPTRLVQDFAEHHVSRVYATIGPT